jgi:hypothetical protein
MIDRCASRSATFGLHFSALVVLTALTLCSPGWFLLNFVGDDALFYVVIANHFAHGLGSTFDGINPTNGYHPLWMVLLSGWFAMWSPFVDTMTLSPAWLLRLAVAFQLPFLLAAFHWCVRLVRAVWGQVSPIWIVTLALLFGWVF